MTAEKKVIAGRIVSGTMHGGDSVGVWPAGFGSRVSEIVVKGARARSAKTGTSVAFALSDSFNSEVRGSVLAGKANPPKPRDTRKGADIHHASQNEGHAHKVQQRRHQLQLDEGAEVHRHRDRQGDREGKA